MVTPTIPAVHESAPRPNQAFEHHLVESKRIIAVGDGRDKCVFDPIHNNLNHTYLLLMVRFGHAFMMDTGSSTGEIIGHSKVRFFM